MFKFRISKKTTLNVLYLIVLALAVSYIMNKQSTALVSLIFISGITYLLTKNMVISLGLSIIVTNLLLSMNYFVVEGLSMMQNKKEGHKEGMKEGHTEGMKERHKEGMKERHKEDMIKKMQ